jgi:hypothetical protein
MTKNLHTIERLRPNPEDLDSEWSTRVLRDILDEPTPVTRRRSTRRRWGFAAVVVAASLGGGVAYGSSGVPGWVQSRLNEFSGDQGHGDVDLVRIVDFTTPDGNRVVAWRGTSEDGQVCEVLGDNFTTQGAALAQTYHCRSADDESLVATWTTASRPSRIGEQVDPATTFPYVYGQYPDAASVTVVGPGFQREALVDESTGGYAVVLPQAAGPQAELVSFLDADGVVIRTVNLEVE